SGTWASCERLSWSFGIATTSTGSSNAWPIAHRFRQDVTLPLNSRSQRDSMIQLTPSALSTPSGAKQQHLLETWAQFEKEGGIGKTDFDPQYDYLESKPFSYVERLINNLRNLAGEGLHLSGNSDNSQLSPSPAGRTV